MKLLLSLCALVAGEAAWNNWLLYQTREKERDIVLQLKHEETRRLETAINQFPCPNNLKEDEI
jgi:hypothetical protein